MEKCIAESKYMREEIFTSYGRFACINNQEENVIARAKNAATGAIVICREVRKRTSALLQKSWR